MSKIAVFSKDDQIKKLMSEYKADIVFIENKEKIDSNMQGIDLWVMDSLSLEEQNEISQKLIQRKAVFFLEEKEYEKALVEKKSLPMTLIKPISFQEIELLVHLIETKNEKTEVILEKMTYLKRMKNQFLKEKTESKIQGFKEVIQNLMKEVDTFVSFQTKSVCENMIKQIEGDLPRFQEINWDEKIQTFFIDFIKSFYEKSDPNIKQEPNQSNHQEIDLFIIDDDEDLLRLYENENQRFHLNLVMQSSFTKALEQISDPHFSSKVIVFDIVSEKEKLSGFDLIKKFYEVHEKANTITGIFTAQTGIDLRKEALKYPVSLFFQKPLEPTQLFSQIQIMISKMQKRKYHVLLLDDDPEFCKFVEMALKDSSFDLHFLNEETTLFEEIDRYNPDLLLLDIMLKNSSGLDVFKMIRSDLRYHFLPIILVTAEENPDLLKIVADLGVQGFFTKPLSPELLMQKISQFFIKYEISKLFYLKDPTLNLYQKESVSGLLDSIILQNRPFTLVYLEQKYLENVPEQEQKEHWLQFCSFVNQYFSKREMIGLWENNQLVISFLDFEKKQIKVVMHYFFQEYEKQIKEPKPKIKCVLVSYPKDDLKLVGMIQKARETIQASKDTSHWEILSIEEKKEIVQLPFKNILLICADDHLESVLKYYFEMKGGSVFSFKEGLEGYRWIIDNLFKKNPQFILIDDSLLGENAFVILQKFQDYIGRRIPLFFFTSFSQELEVIQSQTTYTNIILKPFNFTSFMSALEKMTL